MKAADRRLRAAVRRDRPPRAVQAQVTLDTSGRMLLGTDIASAMTTLEALPRRRDRPQLLDRPRAHARADPLSGGERDAPGVVHSERRACRSTPGTGDAVYPLEPEPMADMLGEFVERVRRAHRRRLLRHDAGASRGDRRSVASETRDAGRADDGRAPRRCRPPARRQRRGSRDPRASSSAMRAIDFDQNPKPLLIGERVNAQGSRKVKRLLLADDYEGIARRRARAGRVGRARARRLRRAHRARRRSRADGEGRQAALDDRRGAAHDRLDRGRP